MKRSSRLWVGVLAAMIVVLSLAAPSFADWEKGVAAFKMKDYTTAVKEFTGVTKTNPNYAGGFYMLGLSQNQLGQKSQAVGNLRKAVKLDPKNPQYQVALAQVLVEAKQYNDAYGVLKGINTGKLGNRQRDLYALLFAQAATKTNRASEAVKVLKREIQSQPKNARLYKALGVAYAGAGNDAQAYTAYAKAYRLNPRDLDAGRSAAYAAIAAGRRSGSASAKVNYYSKAAAIAEKLATAKPSFEHQLLAGESWLGAKQFQKALGWLTKAGAKNPQNALVRYYKGQCHSQLGQYKQALASLQKALKLGPNAKLRKLIYNNLGFVYAKQKKYETALEMYKTAGNSAKVREMQDAIKTAAKNKEAKKEMQEFKQKIKALRAQADELEKLGQVEEARQLREQADKLAASVK